MAAAAASPTPARVQSAPALRGKSGSLGATLLLDSREELRVDGLPVDAMGRVHPEIGAGLGEQLVEGVAHASPSPEEALEKRTSRPARDGSSRSIASISRRA